MFIDDYIEKITLQEEVKNLKSMIETITSKNLELKDQNTVLRNTLISRKYEIDSLKYSISVLKKNAAECKLRLEEKQQEADNLRNRVKDLESEIDQLTSNPTAVSYSELLDIHTADVETINKLNIRAHDVKKKVQQLKNIINDLSEEL